MKETILKINKTERWFFEKLDRIDKLLTTHQDKKRENNQFNKIRMEKGEFTTDSEEVQRLIRDYYG